MNIGSTPNEPKPSMLAFMDDANAQPSVAKTISTQALFDALANGQKALVLVANQRLVKTLSERYAHFRRAQGNAVWEVPNFLSFEQWLEQRAQRLVLARQWSVEDLPDLILNDEEATRLWQDIIERVEANAELLSTRELAQHAQDAHALLQEYGEIPATTQAQEEFQRFCQWHQQFLSALSQRQWATQAQWRHQIVSALTQPTRCKTEFSRTDCVVLVGFDQVRPWLAQWLTHAQGNGVSIQTLAENNAMAERQVIRPKDSDEEHRLVARWARHQLNANPDKKLAIVVTDLAARKRALTRALREEIEPHYVTQFNESASELINISLGDPLNAVPLVAAALRLLQALCQPKIHAKQWSSLLLSPYLAGAHESAQRAQFDAYWRDQGLSSIRESTFLQLLTEGAPANALCPRTAEQWHAAFQQLAKIKRQKYSLAEWMVSVKHLLPMFGWPSRQLSSVEYQSREAFYAVMDSVACQRWPEHPVRFAQAVQELLRATQLQVFQPQQSGHARVHVMGVLEAAGLEADAIWLMDARDDAMPSPLKPNPLLPFAWQQTQQTPRASHEREHRFVTQLLQRMTHSAELVIASCPQHESDAELRLSPFLAHWPEADLAHESWAFADKSHRLLDNATRAETESMASEPVPPLTIEHLVRKDSGLLSLQAINPQLAFLAYRLHARRVESFSDQLLPNERGNLAHIALENLWTSIASSAALHLLSDDELRQRISAVCHGALEQRARHRKEDWPSQWQVLEQRSLEALLWDWMTLEKARQSGFRVKANEQQVIITLQQLPLRLRLDRVDTLDDGRIAIIDYKTGKSWRKPQWLDERPADVQLFLYALSADQPLAAVIAGRLLANECRFEGLSEHESLSVKRDKILDEWNLAQLQTRWRDVLSQLAQEFIDGVSENRCYHSACFEHPLSPFLRLQAHEDGESSSDEENEFSTTYSSRSL